MELGFAADRTDYGLINIEPQENGTVGVRSLQNYANNEVK